MIAWEDQRAEGYRSARMVRGVVRFVFYTACAAVLPFALVFAAAWAGAS